MQDIKTVTPLNRPERSGLGDAERNPQLLVSLQSTKAMLDIGSDTTFWRLRQSATENFPRSVTINSRPYWVRDEVAEWARSRPRGS